MKPQLKSSPAARELIQRFEPYCELAAQGSDGRWRVGFGHRAAAREGVRVSREDAALLLIYDVMQAETVIDEMFSEPVPKMQRDALTSFVHDIGATAFRSSDVARYLFEGRIEAAAEALAGYGDGASERREAESAMLLAGRDDALAASAAARKPAMVDLVIKVEHPADPPTTTEPALHSRAALPESLMPPPAPTRQTAARREAESEIARILATVGAMPLEIDSPHPDTLSADQPAEPEPESPVESAETPAQPVEAESVDDAPAADSGDPVDETANNAEPEVEVEPEATPESDGPERVAHDAAPAEPVSAQVIARMSQEIAHVQAVVPSDDDGPETQADDVNILPDGVSLGYAFTGTWPADLETSSVAERVADESPEPEPEAEPAPETQTVSDAEPDSASPEDVQAAIAEVDSAAAAAPGAAPVDLVPAAVAVVERTLAVAGDRTPPPHPADEPAPSEGAIGDIAGEGASADADHVAHIDELAGTADAMMSDAEDEDPLSPHDLVGSGDLFVDSKPVDLRKDDDGWGFVVTLIAGLVVMGAGILDIYGDWPRVWVERDPTWGVLAAVAGAFLVITASWMLGSVLSAKRRQTRGK